MYKVLLCQQVHKSIKMALVMAEKVNTIAEKATTHQDCSLVMQGKLNQFWEGTESKNLNVS